MNTLNKPWLQSYQLGPYKLDHSLLPYEEMAMHQVLDRSAINYPNQTAILFEGRSLKYHTLKNQVDRLANGLARLGIEKGDRVCVYLPNCIEYILSYWAILKAGGVVVPTSILRTGEGLMHEVGSSGSRMMICSEKHLERALEVKEACNLETVLITSSQGYDLQEVTTPLPEGFGELRNLLNECEPIAPQVEIEPRHDLCELAFTGGATGLPKGVMLSHYNRYSVVQQGLPWFMKPLLKGLAGKASVMIAVPLFHAYGNFIHQSAVSLGLRTIVLPDPRDTQAMVDNILEHRPFLIPGVPTQFMRLAEAGLRRSNSMLFSGSAPLPKEVAELIKRKTGMPISEGYGLTETSTMTHINLTAFSRITGFMTREIGGIGVPIPDTDCRLVDPDSGEDTPGGEAGELVVRGPQVMVGYWPEPGSGLSPGGWLHTGDIAVMDEKGYFQIVDRIKDMVNVSGMKVYTTEVDEVLFKHPAVQMAAAFGVPDREIPGSERVMAVICLRNEYRNQVLQDEILSYCKEHLPPYAVPKYIEFREEMPLTVSEKVFKKELREQAISRVRKDIQTHREAGEV